MSKSNITAAQARLMAAGFALPRFGADGDFGNETLAAFNAAMTELEGLRAPTPSPAPPSVPSVRPSALVPIEWMPPARMVRIICHWTAGTYNVSALDREHYHIVIGGDGRLVRGDHSIKDNETAGGPYAAHTKNCNTGSIGVSLACMAGAIESPFTPGKYPMTQEQWDVLTSVVAELSRQYQIPIGPVTVLSHAEVEPTLRIKQAGKWDYTRLAFDLAVKGAAACGDKLRREARAKL